MVDLVEQAASYREQAERERAELEGATLPLVRARHLATIERWERLAGRAEAGAAYRDKRSAVEEPTASQAQAIFERWTVDQDQELVARLEVGEPLASIAGSMGRSISASKKRLQRLRRDGYLAERITERGPEFPAQI